MIRDWKLLAASVLTAFGADMVRSQTPQFATLDIEWENYVAYLDDLADPSKLASSPTIVNASFRNFRTSILIGDIVSVNGRPAKGTFVIRGQLVQLSLNPMPGQAIGDIGRPFLGDYHVEILQTDGTPIGSIMSSGFGSGPAPPGAPPGLLLNLTVTGGTGAFVGPGAL
jgi:hypothetical protein